MSKETVVVTGARGRVGTRIVQALLEAGYAVHALAHSALADGHPLARESVSLSVLNLAALPEQEVAAWLQRVQPVALVHAAALSDVADCERQPELAFLLNARVTALLARVCAQQRLHFVMISSEQVFAGSASPDRLYCEDDPVGPLNCYGHSKAQGEIATRQTCAYRTAWTICRLSVVYGLAYAPGLWRPDFVQWVHSALARGERLRIVADQVNSPIFIDDLSAILVAIVRQRLPGIYHVAGRTPLSRYDCARQIARAYHLDETLLLPVPTAQLDLGARRPLNVGLCIEKVRRETGIHPRSLAAGLAACRCPGA
jgi:dTDP-4-dehydrorhamnose reductase